MDHRVVVTGMGIISPLGCGLTASWQGAKEGKCGIGPITLYDTEGRRSSWPVRPTALTQKTTWTNGKPGKWTGATSWPLPPPRKLFR